MAAILAAVAQDGRWTRPMPVRLVIARSRDQCRAAYALCSEAAVMAADVTSMQATCNIYAHRLACGDAYYFVCGGKNEQIHCSKPSSNDCVLLHFTFSVVAGAAAVGLLHFLSRSNWDAFLRAAWDERRERQKRLLSSPVFRGRRKKEARKKATRIV